MFSLIYSSYQLVPTHLTNSCSSLFCLYIYKILTDLIEQESLDSWKSLLILQVFADALVKKAYDNWMHVIEYDGKALLSIQESKKTGRNEPPPAPANYHAYDQQVSQPSIPASALNPTVAVGGKELLTH